MSFDWNNYYYLAVELDDRPPANLSIPEGKKRASISRAYYAALMQARNYLEKYEGFVDDPESSTSHADIIHQFNPRGWNWHNKWFRASREIFDNLWTMKIRRRSADYDNDFMNGETNITQATSDVLIMADTVIKALARLESDPRKLNYRR